MTSSLPRASLRPEETGQRVGHGFTIVFHRDMPGGLDPDEPRLRHLTSIALGVVDPLEFIILTPNKKFWGYGFAHRGHQFHRIAVVRGAGESEPGPRDARLSPGIAVLRGFGFPGRTSN